MTLVDLDEVVEWLIDNIYDGASSRLVKDIRIYFEREGEK